LILIWRYIMGLTETIWFYLLFGAGIAAAVALRSDGARSSAVWFRIITALFFWPLYLPILLERPARDAVTAVPQESNAGHTSDEFDTAIARVEVELETALDSLDGWAENVLSREQNRFVELRTAWRLQADRIRQLDRLLAGAEEPGVPSSSTAALNASAEMRQPRFRQSEQARRDNMLRLHAVRRRLHDDLMGTLAWVRELVSMIHLAKFTGAPASRAEELVAQIATAVEGLSEVSQWREDPVEVDL
jgi:hypothetical protein